MSRTTFIFLLFNLIINVSAIIAVSAAATSPGGTKVYIVLTDKPDGDPVTYYVKILTSVLGSEEAARKALVYVYQFATQGFAATLTSEQANLLSKYPGVLSVSEDQLVPPYDIGSEVEH